MIGLTLMQEEYLDNSISLASKIQDQFSGLNRKSRGVKQAPFMVLHKAYMPRVLIETGFISNPVEGAMLDSEDGQQDIAQAIANAIISYKKEYYGSSSSDQIIKPSKKVLEEPKNEEPEKSNSETETEKSPVKTESSEIIFKVQIAAANKKLDLIPSNFKGLTNVQATTDNGQLYKYTYGETTDYAVAKNNLAEAKDKGYSSAYIIAYKDGKKISVQDALK
jgi:N-acetylmuramoyl-L-alanine amidase